MLICSSWDDWVPHDRLRKFTEENKELAQDLKREMDDSRARAAPKSTSTKKKTAGSDFSSARGSEERHSSLPVTGRGSKRGRDTEIEKVGGFYFCVASSPCPDLEPDTSESGWSGTFDHAITPEFESEPVFACYDGTGDPPARRSERKPKPRTVFEQQPTPSPQSKRRKTTPKAATPAVGEAASEDSAVTTKSALHANKTIPPTSAVQAAKQKAVSISGNQNETTVATTQALVNNGNGSSVHDAEEAPAVLEDNLSAKSVAAKASTKPDPALPGTSNNSRSSSSLTPPPISADEAEESTPKPTAQSRGRKPAVKGKPKATKGKGKALPVDTSSPDQVEPQKSVEITENGLAADTSKPAAKGKVTAAKGKGKALSVDPSNASPDPVEPQKNPEITENGLSASKSTAKDNDSPPGPTKLKITLKAKGAKGKNKASSPGASETLASPESGDGSQNHPDPAPAKPKNQRKGGKAKAKASPPQSTSSFVPRTTLEVLQNNPPTSTQNSKKPLKPRYEKTQSKADYLAEKTALLDEPQRISDTYLPESNHYRHHEDKHFFYAGIPADMDRKPRRVMGPPKVCKQRAKWMKFRKTQRRSGLSRLEINRKWEAVLAEAENARVDLAATAVNENGQSPSTSQGSQPATITIADQGSQASSSSRSGAEGGDGDRDVGTLDRLLKSSGEDITATTTQTNPASPEAPTAQSTTAQSTTSQNNQGSSSSSGPTKKRKTVTFAADVPDPSPDSTPTREESPPKRARTSKTSKLNPRSYDSLQEESFLSRAAVRIPVSDHLKALLVDDWEAVTKNLSLVPLPSEHPVTEILAHYLEEEKAKRRVGSAEYDLLEEVVAGVKEYFNRCLGRILLYRFEREQFFEISKLWDEGREGWEGKGPSDAYGAEHLTRLFGMFLFPSPFPFPPSPPNFIHPSPPSLHIHSPTHLTSSNNSHPPRTHRPDKHGRPIRQPSPRGTHQNDPVAGQTFAELLRCRLREPESGVYR